MNKKKYLFQIILLEKRKKKQKNGKQKRKRKKGRNKGRTKVICIMKGKKTGIPEKKGRNCGRKPIQNVRNITGKPKNKYRQKM